MYEPPEAISTQVGPIGQGEAEPVQKVVESIREMKKSAPTSRFFYGGSVKSHNIAGFLSQPEVDGVVRAYQRAQHRNEIGRALVAEVKNARADLTVARRPSACRAVCGGMLEVVRLESRSAISRMQGSGSVTWWRAARTQLLTA